MLIIAVGTMFFVGIKITAPDMFTTAEKYFRENNLFDFRLISTLGLYDEDVDEIKKLDFVTKAEGSYSTDVLVTVGFLLAVYYEVAGLRGAAQALHVFEALVDLANAGGMHRVGLAALMGDRLGGLVHGYAAGIEHVAEESATPADVAFGPFAALPVGLLVFAPGAGEGLVVGGAPFIQGEVDHGVDSLRHG